MFQNTKANKEIFKWPREVEGVRGKKENIEREKKRGSKQEQRQGEICD